MSGTGDLSLGSGGGWPKALGTRPDGGQIGWGGGAGQVGDENEALASRSGAQDHAMQRSGSFGEAAGLSGNRVFEGGRAGVNPGPGGDFQGQFADRRRWAAGEGGSAVGAEIEGIASGEAAFGSVSESWAAPLVGG